MKSAWSSSLGCSSGIRSCWRSSRQRRCSEFFVDIDALNATLRRNSVGILLVEAAAHIKARESSGEQRHSYKSCEGVGLASRYCEGAEIVLKCKGETGNECENAEEVQDCFLHSCLPYYGRLRSKAGTFATALVASRGDFSCRRASRQSGTLLHHETVGNCSVGRSIRDSRGVVGNRTFLGNFRVAGNTIGMELDLFSE